MDAQQATRLAERAQVAAGDSVLEIGTGLGVLTHALAARAGRVVTLEVDAGLVRALRDEAMLPENAELRHADALRTDLRAIVVELPPPVRVVANLPYSVASPLLRRLLDLRGGLAGWAVMLQRELAERLLASPGTRAYGSLTVLHRLCATLERAGELSPRCFHPVPRVRSSFLRMTPLADAPLGPGELPAVERVVRAAFSARRKTLANALRGGLETAPPAGAVERACAEAGVDPRARAEALSPEAHLALARALARNGPEGLPAGL